MKDYKTHALLILKLIFGQMSFFIFIPTVSALNLVVKDVYEDVNFERSWYERGKTEEENFKKLIVILERSETGKAVTKKAALRAKDFGMTLYDVLESSHASYTDTTLIRRFSAGHPQNVMFETRSKIFLNRQLKLSDALLDLAHEMTHYSYREPFNPYGHRFGMKDFISSTVEGKGGEVEAYMVECQVFKEIFSKQEFFDSKCYRIFDGNAQAFSKEKTIHEFYKVGEHLDDFKKEFNKLALESSDIPLASREEALFISSAWGLPYPVAAQKEYFNIMDRVCKNDQYRIELMGKKVRQIASEDSEKQSKKIYQNMYEDYKSRCQKFTLN